MQLQRVFSNLIINAINHSRRGDHVEIVLEPQASYQVVKILDTGAGIQREQFPHLFERFYQGNSYSGGLSQRQAKGSGLGLYLSRQIIEAHQRYNMGRKQSSQWCYFCFQATRFTISVLNKSDVFYPYKNPPSRG